MKRLFLLLLLLALCMPLEATDLKGKEFATLKLTSGRVLKDAKILSVYDTECMIMHSGGIVENIKLSLLPEELTGQSTASSASTVAEPEKPKKEVRIVDDPMDCVFIIETDDGRGTGFLAVDNGRVYLYTNIHVIGQSKGLVAISQSNKSVHIGSYAEVATNGLDLVRISVRENYGLKLAPKVSMNEEINAYGNSQGAGMITHETGSVLGVGPTEFEISAQIVPGNSGGPIINSKNEVVGIAAYATKGEKDWTTANTRYANVRRIALRLTDVKWKNTSLQSIKQDYIRIDNAMADLKACGKLINEIIRSTPGTKINNDFKHRKLRHWVSKHNTLVDKINAASKKRYTQNELNATVNSARKAVQKLYFGLAKTFDSIGREYEASARTMSSSFLGDEMIIVGKAFRLLGHEIDKELRN